MPPTEPARQSAPAATEAMPAPPTAATVPAPGGEPIGGKGAPPPPPPPPPPKIEQPMKDQAPMKNAPKSAPRDMEDEKKEAPADKAGIVISPQTLAEKQRPVLAKCLDGKKASLKISVKGDKTTTAVTGEGVTPAMKQCMDAIVQKIEWPLKGTFDLTLKFD
jgi:hypothetical protein